MSGYNHFFSILAIRESQIPPNRFLVSEEEIYGILMLALPILGLKELGVAREMPLLFCS